jgi:hypothetical protein
MRNKTAKTGLISHIIMAKLAPITSCQNLFISKSYHIINLTQAKW